MKQTEYIQHFQLLTSFASGILGSGNQGEAPKEEVEHKDKASVLRMFGKAYDAGQ